MTEIEADLAAVAPAERVLLLSHCLRPSQSCPGKFSKSGLDCPENCRENCLIRRIQQTAKMIGYKGVCIAAGGAMALRFVKDHKPRGIVAVACDKELVAGVDGVKNLWGGDSKTPAIMLIPLLKDGCVDTEVDEERVFQALALGSAA